MPQAGPSNLPLHPPPSSSRSFADLNENSLLEWATRKVNDKTPMNDMELLGLRTFVENVNERAYLDKHFLAHVLIIVFDRHIRAGKTQIQLSSTF